MRPKVHNLIVKYEKEIEKLNAEAEMETMVGGLILHNEAKTLERVITDLKNMEMKR